MIAVRLQGRLGNQLFQHAFIMAASKKLNTGFYIDEFIELSAIDRYFNNVTNNSGFEIRRLFKINGFKNILSFHLRKYYYKRLARVNKLTVYEYDYTEGAADIELNDNKLYLGYFFSELFFDSIKDVIKNKFVLKPTFIDAFKQKYSKLYKNNSIVTVHIRRTDYQNLQHLNLGGTDLSLPLEYYKKALAKFEGQNVHFVFISDDPDFVNENFNALANKTISTDIEIMDFQHLLNADACIISNSTFSWWGAWLNPNKNKAIYCPQYYLGFHLKKQIPQDIYPNEWIQIEFD